jgi:hypothetical protein
MLIFVNDFLLRLPVRCSVCQSNMNTHHSTLTSCSFSTWLYQMDSQWTQTHSVHLTDSKIKFVYPSFYAHLCQVSSSVCWSMFHYIMLIECSPYNFDFSFIFHMNMNIKWTLNAQTRFISQQVSFSLCISVYMLVFVLTMTSSCICIITLFCLSI